MNLRFNMKNSQTKHYIETKQRRAPLSLERIAYVIVQWEHIYMCAHMPMYISDHTGANDTLGYRS